MTIKKKVAYTIGFVVGASLLVGVIGRVNPGFAEEEAYDEDKYGPKALMVWHTPVPRVTFSHKVHTMDAGLECDSCHDDLFTMEAGAVAEKGDFTMQAFAGGQYCGACHDGDTAFSTTNDKKCAACHTAPDLIVFSKPVKAVIFDHKIHVNEMGLGCGDCHSDLFKMHIGDAETDPEKFVMESLYKGGYCGACHDGEQAFASNTRCTTCHIGVMGFDRLFGHGEKKTVGH